ncbi:MAG: hypothetical protein AAB367_00135 [Patescibacteria group bacterium]
MPEQMPALDEQSQRLQELIAAHKNIKDIPMEELVNVGYERDFRGVVSKIEEVREYDFEAGVHEAADALSSVYEKAKEDIIVVINGSSVNVGKSFFRRTLVEELAKRGVPVGGSINAYTGLDVERRKLGEAHTKPGSKPQSVYFSEEIDWTAESLTEKFQRQEMPRYAADYYIGIYRPDVPFREKQLPLADIIVKNDHAINKSKPK